MTIHERNSYPVFLRFLNSQDPGSIHVHEEKAHTSSPLRHIFITALHLCLIISCTISGIILRHLYRESGHVRLCKNRFEYQRHHVGHCTTVVMTIYIYCIDSASSHCDFARSIVTRSTIDYSGSKIEVFKATRNWRGGAGYRVVMPSFKPPLPHCTEETHWKQNLSFCFNTTMCYISHGCLPYDNVGTIHIETVLRGGQWISTENCLYWL